MVLPAPPAAGQLPRGLWCYRIDARRVVVGGALTDGGSMVQWGRELMGITSEQVVLSHFTRVSILMGGKNSIENTR